EDKHGNSSPDQRHKTFSERPSETKSLLWVTDAVARWNRVSAYCCLALHELVTSPLLRRRSARQWIQGKCHDGGSLIRCQQQRLTVSRLLNPDVLTQV